MIILPKSEFIFQYYEYCPISYPLKLRPYITQIMLIYILIQGKINTKLNNPNEPL